MLNKEGGGGGGGEGRECTTQILALISRFRLICTHTLTRLIETLCRSGLSHKEEKEKWQYNRLDADRRRSSSSAWRRGGDIEASEKTDGQTHSRLIVDRWIPAEGEYWLADWLTGECKQSRKGNGGQR